MNANSLILKVFGLKLKKQTFNLFELFISYKIVMILLDKITSNKLLYLPKYRL